jgi:hypothetical protein
MYAFEAMKYGAAHENPGTFLIGVFPNVSGLLFPPLFSFHSRQV